MVDFDQLYEALKKAQEQYEVGLQNELELNLKANDLPGIKYAAGQLFAMRTTFLRVFSELNKAREE